MEVGSVSSSSGAAAAAARQSVETQQSQPVERREPKPEENKVADADAPRPPVKNAEGQTTGTVVNVTA